jgi:guanylate kinase
MITAQPGRLVILSGPSCVCKSPLSKALARLYPELRRRLQPLVLYNSRAPRPGEVEGVDYYFRTREQVAALQADERHIVLDVRGDLHGLDLEHTAALLQAGNAFFEGNPFVGRILHTHRRLAPFEKLGVFLSPLSQEEILFLKTPERHGAVPELVAEVMRRKLLRRTQRHKGELSLQDLETIERRAASAYGELREAHQFAYVIPNHDGEDSENWDAFYYPLGDARNALLKFAALLEGTVLSGVEHWEPGLIP